VKRCCYFCFLVFVLTPIITHPALADAAKPAQQPVGVFTDDNGERILVGIGTTKPLATLDVSRGEVKVGSTGALCTPKLAGTLRYAGARLQFCDGTGWRNVSLDKGE
jgi:hypothetical protein